MPVRDPRETLLGRTHTPSSLQASRPRHLPEPTARPFHQLRRLARGSRAELSSAADSQRPSGSPGWQRVAARPAEGRRPYIFRRRYGLQAGQTPTDRDRPRSPRPIGTGRRLRGLRFRWRPRHSRLPGRRRCFAQSRLDPLFLPPPPPLTRLSPRLRAAGASQHVQGATGLSDAPETESGDGAPTLRPAVRCLLRSRNRKTLDRTCESLRLLRDTGGSVAWRLPE